MTDLLRHGSKLCRADKLAAARQFGCRRRCRFGCCRIAENPAGNLALQCAELIFLGNLTDLVHVGIYVILRNIGRNRHVAFDCRQLFRQIGHFLVCQQFFLQFHPGDLVNIRINPVNRAKIIDQFLCGFLAHSGHAGNIVRRIAHQALHLDHLLRCKAITERQRRRVDFLKFRNPSLRQQHPHIRTDQLQCIPVACHDQDFLVCTGFGGQCADDIIRFKPCDFQHGDSQRLQHFAGGGELLGQLRRGRFALRLVFGVLLIAEGVFAFVERHHDACRFQVGDQLDDHIGKAEHRIGELPV